MRTLKRVVAVCAALGLAGCGTYYDPSDPYTLGLRWHDRGRMDLAAQVWQPLVEKNDPDAQFRYGWLLWTNVLGPDRELEAMDLFQKAAEQGQPKALLILGDLYYQSPNNPLWQVENAPFEKDIEKALGFYLRAQKMAYYPPEKKALEHVLPKIKAEIEPQRVRAAEIEADAWKPVIVGREPRRLL